MRRKNGITQAEREQRPFCFSMRLHKVEKKLFKEHLKSALTPQHVRHFTAIKVEENLQNEG
jgi:hypothetical protein